MIGIFDSGVGGLTIVKEVFRLLPQYQVIYFGDLARSPYGTKSKETVIRFAHQIVKFLHNEGAKIVIVACNTASAEAADSLRKEFKIPIFDVISPQVKEALKITKNKKIGVIGTKGTIESQAYQKALKNLDPNIELYTKACPLFVSLIEENFTKRPETKKIARFYLRELKNYGIDTLILGCTHYLLLEKTISQVMGKRVTLVDSRKVTNLVLQEIENNKKLKGALQKGSLVSKGQLSWSKGKNHQFYFSDLPNNFVISEFAKFRNLTRFAKAPARRTGRQLAVNSLAVSRSADGQELSLKFLGQPPLKVKLVDLDEIER